MTEPTAYAVSITKPATDGTARQHLLRVADTYDQVADIFAAMATELADEGTVTLPTLIPATGLVPEHWHLQYTFTAGPYAGDTETGRWFTSDPTARHDAFQTALVAAGYTAVASGAHGA